MKKKIIRRILLIAACLILFILGVLFVFPYLENVSAEPLEDSADWMKDMGDDVSLADMNLPGTHDSATAYVQLPFFMRCQSLSVKEQLEAGYRYLDIRLNEENGKMVFYHSFAQCQTSFRPWAEALDLGMVLKDIYGFLEHHPTETVVFVVKQEGSGDLETFQKTLHQYIGENREKWLLSEEVPTLGEARGKIVLLRRYEDAAGYGTESGIALNWGDQGGEELQTPALAKEDRNGHVFYIQDRYNYTMEHKKTALNEGLSMAKEQKDGKVRIHFVTTAGPSSLNHPFLVSLQMNDWYLKQGFEGDLGWIIFDHGDGELAKSVYQLNFN